MANRLKAGVLGCLVIGLAACGTTEAPGPLTPSGATARVRFVNLITDANRAPVNASLEGVSFGAGIGYAVSSPALLASPSSAPYASVLAGARTFVLKRTADTTVTVASVSFTIAADEDRSVYAIGGAGGSAVTGFVTTDSNPVSAATATRIRVVQLSPTAGAVDVFITAVGADLSTATPVYTGLAYQTASAYQSIAPGTYQVRAVPAGTAPANRATSVSINLASTVFAGGTGRTIVLADNNVGGAPMRAFVLADR